MFDAKKATRPAHVQHFINLHVHDARTVSCASGIPVSVILAQSALETGWGRYVKGGSYFGVKGKSPSGKSVKYTTHENINGKRVKTKAGFREYESFLESAKDYAHVIRNNYHAAMVHKNDPLKFVEHLKRYATRPNYTKLLKEVITSENLSDLDNTACKGGAK